MSNEILDKERINDRSLPTIRISPTRGWRTLDLTEIWHYRELLLFLIWRDVKVRYKQTILGVLWVILQPLISVSIFTLIFGLLLRVSSRDIPYPIFAYAGLLPWQYFSSVLGRSSTSLINNAHIIRKVYFPRVLIPLSSVFSSLIDFILSFLLFLVLMAYYCILPNVRILLIPLLILLMILTVLGFSLWFSGLNVRYRDVNYLLPFLIRIWMYLTPVVYGSDLMPERFRLLLSLNPMTGVVEGFRWALLGPSAISEDLSKSLIGVSFGISLMVLVSGIIFFRNTERSFADIV